MKQMKRICAILMMLLFLAGVECSFAYLAQNAQHHCADRDCPICLQLSATAHILSQIKAMPAGGAVLALLCVFAQFISIEYQEVFLNRTLITQKVELLN